RRTVRHPGGVALDLLAAVEDDVLQRLDGGGDADGLGVAEVLAGELHPAARAGAGGPDRGATAPRGDMAGSGLLGLAEALEVGRTLDRVGLGLRRLEAHAGGSGTLALALVDDQAVRLGGSQRVRLASPHPALRATLSPEGRGDGGLRHELARAAGGFGGAAGGVVEGALVLQPLLRQALVDPVVLGLLDLADEIVDGKAGLFLGHAERSGTDF